METELKYAVWEQAYIRDDLQDGVVYDWVTFRSTMPKGRTATISSSSWSCVHFKQIPGYTYSKGMLTTPPTLSQEVEDALESIGITDGWAGVWEKDSEERPKTRIDPKTGRVIKTRRTPAEVKAEKEAKEKAKAQAQQWDSESEDKEEGQSQEQKQEEQKQEEEDQDGIVNNKEELEIINCAVKANIPLLLIGETGTGKTTLVRHEAKKRQKELVRINLNGQTGREELIGKYVLIGWETIWQDWPMVTALRKGHWILLDEINAALPEVLFVIQALAESNHWKLGHILLAEKDWEVIIPHPETRLFWTANPSDKYIGTKDFNPATLSRFLMLQIDVLSQAKERELLSKKFPKMDKGDILKVTEIGMQLRKLSTTEQTEYFCSTRDLVYMSELIQSWLSMEQAFKVVVLNKIQTESEKVKISEAASKILSIPAQKAKEIVTEIEEIKEMMKKASESKEGIEQIKTENRQLKKAYEDKNAELSTLKEQVAKLEELKRLLS